MKTIEASQWYITDLYLNRSKLTIFILGVQYFKGQELVNSTIYFLFPLKNS